MNRMKVPQQMRGEKIREILHTEHTYTHIHTHIDAYLCFDQMPHLESIRKIYARYIPVKHGITVNNSNSAITISKWQLCAFQVVLTKNGLGLL